MPSTSRPLFRLCLSIVVLTGAAFAESSASLKELPPAVYQQLAKLTASDGTAGSELGYSIAVSSDGNTIVVGAYGVNANTVKDAAYVFVKPASGWADAVETAELTPSDSEPGNPFGISVAISGNNVYVGSRIATLVTDNKYTYGAIYVYTEPSGGWISTTETAKLTAGTGCSCAIGTYIAAGGNSVVSAETGLSSYQQLGLLVWNKPQSGWAKGAAGATLATSDVNTNWDSVAMSTTGNTIAAGNGSIVYVYAKPSGGWNGKNLVQTAQLLASDGNINDQLGWSVATTDSTVAAGAIGRNDDQGAVYVYVKPSGGWVNAEENAQLSAADGPFLGYSVGISGNTIVAGSIFANVNGEYQAGAAFVYTKPSTGWKTTSHYAQELSASDASEESYLGSSLAIGASTIVAGAELATVGSNSQQGAAYLFAQ
jgi:FG-GAP repeat protein